MLALAAPMTVLFLAAEVIAHLLDRSKARRARLAGSDLAVAPSVENDRALRDLGEGRGADGVTGTS